MLALAAVCAVAALAAAGTASAASPTLLTVDGSGGHGNATWSLAPGGQTWTVEVATSPAIDTDGGFVSENVVDIYVFMDSSTSWTGTADLDPGTYYVHVSGSSCASCDDVAWSAVKSFNVGGSKPPPTTSTTTTATTTAPSLTTTSTSTTTTAQTTTAQTTTVQTTTVPTPTTPTTTTGSPSLPPPPQFTGLRPVIASVALGRATRSLQGTIRVCARDPGRLVLRSVARLGDTTLASHEHLAAAAPGCWPYLVSLALPVGSGPATVTLRVGDAAGAWSPAVTRRVP